MGRVPKWFGGSRVGKWGGGPQNAPLNPWEEQKGTKEAGKRQMGGEKPKMGSGSR